MKGNNMENMFTKPVNVAFVSTYPPRKCGIATFTYDIYDNLKNLYGFQGHQRNEPLQIVALNKSDEEYEYNGEVCFCINDQKQEDYRRVADYINLSPVEVVSLQHEFGIFGGDAGSYVLHLLDKLKKPVVTTFHTILKRPTRKQKKVISQISAYSTLIIVMAQKAVTMLNEIYGVPREKILMVHHGTPDVPFLDSSYYKEQFNAEGRQIILTFGMLDHNKGIEYVIRAMPEVVKEYPEALFIVLGATHPETKRKYGEKHRHFLEKEVAQRKLQDNVYFYNHYVPIELLIQFLIAADIYITPYLGKERITSGTLAYAVSTGKAIISTPYHYAEELLAEDRGKLISFQDSDSIAKELKLLLGNDKLRNLMRKRAYQYGRKMVWSSVVEQYADAFSKAIEDYSTLFSISNNNNHLDGDSFLVPEIDLRHLDLMTDNNGLLHHAIYTVPDRKWGYSTRNNALALVVSLLNWQLYREQRIIPFIQTYLSLLSHAYDSENGWVRSVQKYGGIWKHDRDELSHSCALFALGWTVSHAPTGSILGMSARLFKQLLAPVLSFKYPVAQAYSLLGALLYLEKFHGEIQSMEVVKKLSQELLSKLEANSDNEWVWFENVVGEDNARLPQALIEAGYKLNDENMKNKGLAALEWLISVQTNPIHKHLSLIGDRGWYQRGEIKERYDQRPREACALVDACQQAYFVTKEIHWKKSMEWAFNWYFGGNDHHASLYDYTTSGCSDGLQPTGINFNQGGEALTCFLLSLHKMHQLASKQVLMNADLIIS